MAEKLSDNLINFTTMLMVAQGREEVVHIAGKIFGLVEDAMDMERVSETIAQDKTPSLSTSIKFTQKEIEKMSKTFKKEFIANGLIAHVIKRPSGKKGFYYEIRYRRNGFNVTASNKDLKKAKELFILATKNLESPEVIGKEKLKFKTLLNEWIAYKKGKIAQSTVDGYASLSRRLIGEDLLEKNVMEIRTADIDEYMPDFEEEPRRYEDLRTIFNGVFKYAIASGVVSHNPVTLIPFKRAERGQRVSLTDDQIRYFLKKIVGTRYDSIRQCAYVLYFFGLRPCEVDKDLRFEGGFLISRNRKRKGGKIEYKKIPVPKQAQGLIEFDKPIVPTLSYDRWLDLMKEALPDDLTPYNLRHTFATKCSEPTDIKPEVVDIWMGDSPQRLVGKHYVHFSDEFMREKMDLVNFPTL